MLLSPTVPVSIVVGLAGAGAILLSAGGRQGRARLDRFLPWQDRRRQRAAPGGLDARLLRDVGLSREQAEGEGRHHD
ncbi:DUF1127 domain-containing protein [Xanthobacter sp. DSM 24535]|uniref:DUF1127 domain-containing protein n=1 Tax=Roseixanthobacter psychrophilus TaxID=3119917 RepID=UPI00372A5BE2